MKRIDRETVQRILDTADIVDVVSDFVTLKRRGANYIGLCPFHNERTPSFSVSRTKGICKCFSCGKGGSPVNFLMELEQMSFNDALRWLAKKYNIEIQEHEMSDAEREQADQRENMFAVNDYALQSFASNLTDTPDGRAIGLAYFRDRGISDTAIARFKLGYALDQPTALYDALHAKGYADQAIFDTGLCMRRDDGRIYDRFRGRVIYPVHTISGKVVAFGGRTLRNDKKVAKYVNSPESIIYSKSRELYGLYQAKNAIARNDKCILVEGYMDVISMSQSGVENVVASSGTSLTEGQIRLIHRFTSNVTVIYDSDAAGIKASLRGIDMLLAEGLSVKVVLLPDGDDPDSFAQSHSTTEVEEYIAANETDFIRFKTRILLDGCGDDPTKRAAVISDIVKSISVIPNEITRAVYIQECSRSLDIDEHTLAREVARIMATNAEKAATDAMRQKAHESIADIVDTPPAATPAASAQAKAAQAAVAPDDSDLLMPVERELARYVLKYGMVTLDFLDESGNTIPTPVIDYIKAELDYDNLELKTPSYRAIYEACLNLRNAEWDESYARHTGESTALRQQQWQAGEADIAASAQSLDQIKARETALAAQIDDSFTQRDSEFRTTFFTRRLMSSPDDAIRAAATDLATSRHRLSRVHSKFQKIESEIDRLADRLPQAIFGLKDAHVQIELRRLRNSLRTLSVNDDSQAIASTLVEISRLDALRREYARCLGDRVVAPKG